MVVQYHVAIGCVAREDLRGWLRQSSQRLALFLLCDCDFDP
jgi:hypothetical protein